jgi:hypothetical protein
MMAQPYHQGDVAAPAFVYEGDRLGEVFRQPGNYLFIPLTRRYSSFGYLSIGQFEPYDKQAIMAANHFVVYGYDPAFPLNNFGRQVYFSSLWRFEAGKDMTQAKLAMGEKFGTPQMVQLLRTVSHATTEHSVLAYHLTSILHALSRLSLHFNR